MQAIVRKYYLSQNQQKLGLFFTSSFTNKTLILWEESDGSPSGLWEECVKALRINRKGISLPYHIWLWNSYNLKKSNQHFSFIFAWLWEIWVYSKFILNMFHPVPACSSLFVCFSWPNCIAQGPPGFDEQSWNKIRPLLKQQIYCLNA